MNKVNILIVEDESIVAEALSAYLTESGYETDCVVSGENAIRIVEKNTPDLIIMDIHLQGQKDGIDTAKEIKKTFSTPVIFLTDYDDDETYKRATLTKPANYLLKPFNERQILISIHQALYNVSHGKTAKLDDPYEPEEDYYVVNNCLFIKSDRNNFQKIPLHKILYIQAGRAYSDIFTSETKYMQTKSMNHVHEGIRHPSFIQVHRSYVVNLDQVEAIKGNMLIIGKSEIPIGDSFREDVMKRFPLL